ncbi:MAG: WhiB family transcriptional regulator [Propionibacterium sp.]|nr:WhiB family transcriptional regulator [Propionibacterium sp.]MBB1575695.1 WhiB family transcriptional regulator [Propionibacterium sp.]MDO4645963.1 WhiB family transcriptional regulator [Propionibacteriaceae bacterium]
MTIALDDATPCVKFASLFQDPLLEDEAASVGTAADLRAQAALMARAASLCGECPLRAECLVEAVVSHDVAGFVAGTTESQRREIRSRLDVTVTPEDLDIFAGVSSGRNFDHAEIHRLRQANPNQSLSTIAARVGCSVSTVKRHLRRADASGQDTVKPIKKRKPSRKEVMEAAAEVLQPEASVA